MEGCEEEERSTVGVMPLSRSLQHKTEAGAGWHRNGMEESGFLGGETETETAALPLERVKDVQMEGKRRSICWRKGEKIEREEDGDGKRESGSSDVTLSLSLTAPPPHTTPTPPSSPLHTLQGFQLLW